MAVIKCENCKQDISEFAKYCPNCGSKNNINSKTLSGLDIIFLILLIAYSIFTMYNLYAISTSLIDFLGTYNAYSITLADYIYYIDVFLYNITTALFLWSIFIYCKSKINAFGLIGGILVLTSIILCMIYVISYIIYYSNVSIISVCTLIANRYIIIGILYILAIKLNKVVKKAN